ncbi:MAG: tail fiber protein [Actinomycetota bacterium]|nr:tail fiber protein [Actinomycetota bacterium]MDQ2956678.1 tail fiber protein [Actinomycetota bacterium]
MSQPFLGEIKVVSFNFPPRGWAFCNGQLLPINQNQALFSILGTVYGGDGITTFALPNLQGRMPLHTGNGINLGDRAGEVSHTLTINEMPAHNHPAMAQSAAAPTTGGDSPNNTVWATTLATSYLGSANVAMNPAAVSNAGSSQPHENQAPYLTLNFIVALQGIFPSRN